RGHPLYRNLLNELLDLAAGGCATLKQAQSEALGVTL
ncbi:MAG: ribonuclease PH, partial [Cutibacterium acnes]